MIKVTLQSFENATQGQQSFGLSTTRYLEDMVNDPTFLGRLISVPYTRNIYFPNDKYQIEATNDDLVRVITGGLEWRAIPSGVPDNEIDLQVKLVPNEDGILGGADHPDPTIKTNPVYYNRWYEANDWLSLAGHWFHEWLHVAGFQHAYREAGVGPDFGDAVYVVGNLLVEVARERAEVQKSGVPSRLGQGYFDLYHSDESPHNGPFLDPNSMARAVAR
ncbi:hypothetical protein [Pyxidicoccus trucidator]|uniref:hypothetical protein n=1 Tax=Pyxidicoccus trucidator TaxID=2709662 RepID=UPI0013DC71C2|nr:hypothetical protein [Pyxidicoccus trucidator]